MSSISAGTTVGTALVNAGDTTGELVLKTNGTTTAVTIGTNQVVTLAQALPVGSGGTGATTLTANNVLLGNGTSALQAVAPGTSGNLLTSNGTTWTSAAPPSSTPTTAQVLSATAGLTAGAVGSYMFANRVTNSSLTYNSTVAGSDLRPSGAIQFSDVNAQPSGTALSGTWRLLGNIVDGGGFSQPGAIRSLFIRIS